MHPLTGDLTVLTDEELHRKISELHKRLGQAYRMGMGDAVNQLQMLFGDYQAELQKRNEKMLEAMSKKSAEFKGIIDIQ